jgi:hypothetical protein
MAKLKLATLDSPSSRGKGKKGKKRRKAGDSEAVHNSSPTTITHQPDLDDDDQCRKPGLGWAGLG